MADNNDAKKKEKDRKKKERDRKRVSLPSARRRLLQSREMAQGKRTYEDLWKLAGTVLAFLGIMFVLLGGINQRAAVETIVRWGNNVGRFVSYLINPNSINLTENGVYIDPEHVSENIEELQNEREDINEQEENQDKTEEDKEEKEEKEKSE